MIVLLSNYYDMLTVCVEISILLKGAFFRRLLKSDTAIQEPEPGTGTGTAHNLCKLSHFITAGDISNNIFQGGDRFRAIR